MARPVDAKTRRAQHEEREFAERYGTPVARAPLTTAPEAPPSIAKRAGKGIVGWFRTAAITLGVFWLTGLALLTWSTTNRVSTRWRPWMVNENMGSAVAAVRPGLEYRLPFDPTISAEAAGEAAAALPRRTAMGEPAPGFRLKSTPNVGAPWRAIPLPRDLFDPRTVSPNGGTGLPMSPRILSLSRGPLNAQQRDALKLVGTAPVWRSVDLVGRAQRIDMNGGRFVLPFGDEARGWSFPATMFVAVRDLGHASLVRAAWHVSEGRMDSAEVALRAIISYGAALMENGVTSGEFQAGSSLVRTGSEGLGTLWQLRGDPRGARLLAATSAAERAGATDPRFQPMPRGDLAATERRLIELIRDPDIPRALKPEIGRLLHSASCGSVAGLFRGPTGASKEAIDAMRRDYVRSSSDNEILKIFDYETTRLMPEAATSRSGPWAGPSNFLSSVYFNPRMGVCTLTGLGYFGPIR